MVVALEPHIGCWHLQDMVLVTGGAPRLLSPLINTDEIMIAGQRPQTSGGRTVAGRQRA